MANIFTFFNDLMIYVSNSKNSKIIVEIITNIAPGRLTQSKMICIKDLVDSNLFKMPDCRAVLLPVFCNQIKDKLESKEEVRLCVNVFCVCVVRNVLIIVTNSQYHHSIKYGL